MWRGLWIFLIWATLWLGAGLSAEAGISQSSSGPTSTEERELIAKEGKAAFDQGDYQEAITRYQRLIDRYPAAPGYLDAHLYLGIARLRLKQPKQALEPLKYYVQAQEVKTEADQGRLWLAQAYLGTKKFPEALLLTQEIKTPIPPDVETKSLLLRARAQMGLKKDWDATRSLDSAKKIAEENHYTSLLGESAAVAISLKTRACALLPNPKSGALDEAQTRQQFDRRGTCLIEAVLLFRDVLKSEDEEWVAESQTELMDSFKNYSVACLNPPPAPGKRTTQQAKQYKSELVGILAQDCKKTREKAKDLLAAWKQGIPTSLDRYIVQLSKTLER
jgi:tetratricopeptide (TPR) repeat protein